MGRWHLLPCLLACAALIATRAAHAQPPASSESPPASTAQAAPPAWSPPPVATQPLPPGAQPWTPPAGPPAYGPLIVMPPGYLDWPGRWPRRVKVDEADAPPPLGYHQDSEPSKPLWIAGTVVFSAVQGMTTLIALGMIAGSAGSDVEQHPLLLLPVAGPIAWAQANQPDGEAVLGIMAALSGAQATGLALLIAGVSVRRPVHVRNDVSSTDPGVSVGLGPGGATFGLEF